MSLGSAAFCGVASANCVQEGFDLKSLGSRWRCNWWPWSLRIALVVVLGCGSWAAANGWSTAHTIVQAAEDGVDIKDFLRELQVVIMDEDVALEDAHTFFAAEVELLGTHDAMGDLRRLYAARVLADREFLQAVFLEILRSFRSEYYPGIDSVTFVLEHEFDWDEGEEARWDDLWEAEWQRLYIEKSQSWDDQWFQQWNDLAGRADAGGLEPDTNVDYLSPGEWAAIVETARAIEEHRLLDADHEYQERVAELYVAFLLSNQGWEEELYWVFSDTFWQWPGYYRLSADGNLLIPGDLAAFFFLLDPVMFHLEDTANEFGPRSSVHYTVLDTGQQGYMDLFFAHDATGLFITAMSVAWSEEWEYSIDEAAHWVGFY